MKPHVEWGHMKILLFAKQKGGVGCSMLAGQVAYELRRRGGSVSVMLVDPQGGEGIDEADPGEGDDYLVVDMPGHLSQDTRDFAAAADLGVVPVATDLAGLPAFRRVLGVMRDAAPDVPVMAVPNRVHGHVGRLWGQDRLVMDAVAEAAGEAGAEVGPAVYERNPLRDAQAASVPVREVGGRRSDGAVRDIERLTDAIVAMAGE